MAKNSLRRWFNGTFGNLSTSPTLMVTLTALPAEAVVMFDEPVEPNIKVIGVSLITTALGANTKLTVKVGGTIIINALNSAAAIYSIIPVDDVMTQEREGISLTISGGAATGTVKLKLLYEVVGNL
ncbi:hypothetical protein AB2J22_02055 [Aeromonas sp. A5]|uniref:hypothetical protein n=1 Tax=Aeromonas TaxID=642 RepID=UPI00228583BB|nr:hypothetical protein [Aeromonas enteropelogenes]MCZ0750120.1 hypothetical protein [Aeromonas enteropelogenes]